MLAIKELYKEQLENWPLVTTNYAQLQSAIYREFVFEGFTVKAQFNPERIRSANAKVDAQSVQQRACFLCPANLPEVQKKIAYPPHYNILVNPYPIFPEHLTIADQRHLRQSIEGRAEDMLRLAQDLQAHILLYNAPESGASAPDHFHFQAVNKGCMPIEQDITEAGNKLLLKEGKEGNIYCLKNYLRTAFLLESANITWLQENFKQILYTMNDLHSGQTEPKCNLMLWFENGTGHWVIFPREKHRPTAFYETGDAQLLVSPGIVDMAGLLVIAREEDFEKLNADLIRDIYAQVSISEEEAQKIKDKLKCTQEKRAVLL
ncbi:MAG: DUF4922 domain-containing protein [Dysgonamonadaceae bacterium]|jgi:hypothetical protein|nr:DUF4922 domain-containing protein [Dysgonamonadaceae bacterium]